MTIDIGILVTICLATLGAFFTIGKALLGKFEESQGLQFRQLQDSINEQKKELDGHLGRQDAMMIEMRRVENHFNAQLSECRIDAANRYETKDESGKRFDQLLNEIRTIGSRIDALHSRSLGQ